uniref:Myosin 1H n=1 Tax=Mus musculus TaxID=10090 RepID=A0A0J9YUE0_MOUSE
MCTRNLVRKYCRGISAERKAMMQQKVVTSEIFRGKKEGYAESLNQLFAGSRLDESNINPKVLQLLGSEKIQRSAYLVELSKVKQKIEYAAVRGVSTSSLSDGILVIHISPADKQQKGDVILQCEHIFEVATKLAMLIRKEHTVRVVQGSLQFYVSPGREGTIVFETGEEDQVYKDKNGQLRVVSAGKKT